MSIDPRNWMWNEACAFIDDNEANIATAQQLGIRAVLFRNDGSATQELRAMGLPV